MNLNGALGGSRAERPFCPPSSCGQDSSLHDLPSPSSKCRCNCCYLREKQPWNQLRQDKREKRRSSRSGDWPPEKRWVCSVAKSCLTLDMVCRLPCPSLSTRVCSDSHLSSWWCHPTISVQWVSSLYQMARALELQLHHQSFWWVFINPSGLTGLISSKSKGLSRIFASTTNREHQFFGAQPSLWSNSHPYMTTVKTIAFTLQPFVSKEMSLLFNTLSGFAVALLPRSKRLLISWLQSHRSASPVHTLIFLDPTFDPLL